VSEVKSVPLEHSEVNRKRWIRILAGVGWSVLCSALFLAVAAGSFLGGQALGKRTVSWLATPARGVIAISAALLLVWGLRVKVNRRPWAGMMLPRLQAGRLSSGAICGCSAILLVMGMEAARGWIHFSRIASEPHGGIPNKWMIWLQLIPSLGTGFSEELVYRGYIFQTMAERTKVWVAALASQSLFAVVHIVGAPDLTLTTLLCIMIVGLSFLAMRFVTGSLWFPVGFHAMFDWTQIFPFGLTVGSGPDPSLVHVHLSGPTLWVSGDNDFGLLYLLSVLLTLAIALTYGWYTGNTIPWNSLLAENVSGGSRRTLPSSFTR